MGSDGKYKRTKETVLRTQKTRSESVYSISGRLKEGALAPRPITLPPMPWDKKPEIGSDDSE
jgi:hypothetical protein